MNLCTMPRQDPGGSKDRIRQNEQLALLFPENETSHQTTNILRDYSNSYSTSKFAKNESPIAPPHPVFQFTKMLADLMYLTPSRMH